MSQLTILAILLTLSLSCGRFWNKKRRNSPVIKQPTSTLIERLPFADGLNCIPESPSIKTGTAYFMSQSKTLATPVQEVDFSTEGSLNSQAMEATEYGLTTRQACDSDDISSGQLSNCEPRATIEEASRPLTLCRSVANYERETVEGATFTVATAISKASDFYQSINASGSSKRSLDQINLVMFPEMRFESPKGKLILSDNMAMAASFRGSPSMIIFPRGTMAKKHNIWQDYNIWESAWGVAHEYGHHVFFEHVGVVSGSLLEPTPIIDFRFVDQNAAASSRETPTAATIYSAINEGFADLFAFYSLGEDTSVSLGFDCFQASRTVSEADLSDGQPKVLDRLVLGDFYNRNVSGPETERPEPTSRNLKVCEVPDYTDIHIIGAIAVHGIDKVWNEGGHGGRKHEFLLSWLKELESLSYSASADIDTMGDAVYAGLKQGMENSEGFNAEQCKTIERVFPVFYERWIDNKEKLEGCRI